MRKCEETSWSHKTPGGGFTRGHLVPCTNRARYIASDAYRTVALCGVHTNTARYTNYPGIEWTDITGRRVEG